MNMMDMQQIRINAVLGVCARQRELVAENRKLNDVIASRRRGNLFRDEVGGVVGMILATVITLVCIIGGL